MTLLQHPFPARQEVVRLRECIMSDLNDKRRGEIIRSGIKMSIFGPPNAGKSSLLNYLSACVSSVLVVINSL